MALSDVTDSFNDSFVNFDTSMGYASAQGLGLGEMFLIAGVIVLLLIVLWRFFRRWWGL